MRPPRLGRLEGSGDGEGSEGNGMDMTAQQVIAQHRKLWRDTVAACSGCDWTRFGNLTRTDLAHAAHVLDVLKAAGFAIVTLPEVATEDVDDDERPKRVGDYLKRDDTRSEVWVEGLPGSEPYVFFGRRSYGPSYMPAEYARDVAAAMLAAAAEAEK